jgi:hypothetical protein
MKGKHVYVFKDRKTHSPEEPKMYIIATGKESCRDYVEILDRQNGKQVAYRVYRKGFGAESKSY